MDQHLLYTSPRPTADDQHNQSCPPHDAPTTYCTTYHPPPTTYYHCHKALRVAAQEALELTEAVVGQERGQRIAAEERLQLHEEALAEQRTESEQLKVEGARDQKRLAKLDRLDRYK